MAEAVLDRAGAAARRRDEAIAWALAHWDVIALVGLMGVAAALRFWDLGSRAMHHDESLHATYMWYLYKGRGYVHDPLMHGPFQFHAGALVYFLFGATDYTARALPALFGTALVGLPFFLRKQIGMRAVLIAAVFLTFSPTLLYFSRFARNDIYIAVWTFGMVICIWRYLDEQRPRFLYALAALLALSFATKEVTFITAAIILLFVDLIVAVELGWLGAPAASTGIARAARTVALVPIAWLVAALWPLLGQRPFGRERLPPAAEVLIVLGTLTLPQFAAAIQLLPFVENRGYQAAAENNLRNFSILILLIGSLYVGLLWKPRRWLLAAAFFYVPFVLLFTTFFTNMPGFWTGIWGSLDYWLAQHDVKRGDQPIYYYALVTPLYEFLPLLLTAAGSAWLILRGDSFRRWLPFWGAATFVGLSVAGEKMPWLEVHIALPLAITGAVVLSAAMGGLGFAARRWPTHLLLAGAAAAAALLLVERDVPDVGRYAGLVIAAGLSAWVVVALLNEGRQVAGQVALTVVVAALFTLTVRAGVVATFQHGDIPVEMLVYTQTSPDIPDLRDRIDALGRESGLGRNLPIVVDGTDGFSWPWAWYLRDYREVRYDSPTAPGYKPPEGAVLLINRANAKNVDVEGYTQTPYKHRWWFPETYRGLTLSKVKSILTSWQSLKSLGSFFLHRRAPPPTSSVDSVAFFPDSLAVYDVQKAPPKPAPSPVRLADDRIVIGRPGAGPGELFLPAGVFVDGQGNIWVADSRNNRVQKFDAAGNFLATLGRAGTSAGRFTEPWAVAVDSAGLIYVADTWNHRLQKFSPELEYLTGWGQPATKPNPGPFELYGPRAIAIAPDGSLWVTDTGNKRLVHYSASGEALGTFGSAGSGPGQFEEPVGLAVDGQGYLYVADTWNGRVQKLAPGFASSSQFRAGWESKEVFAKPYIAVLNDGRILASEPAKGILLLFDKDGAPLGSWRPEADSQPIGVAALPGGGFVFSDAQRNEVEVVPEGLISKLFR